LIFGSLLVPGLPHRLRLVAALFVPKVQLLEASRIAAARLLLKATWRFLTLLLFKVLHYLAFKGRPNPVACKALFSLTRFLIFGAAVFDSALS